MSRRSGLGLDHSFRNRRCGTCICAWVAVVRVVLGWGHGCGEWLQGMVAGNGCREWLRGRVAGNGCGECVGGLVQDLSGWGGVMYVCVVSQDYLW